MHGSAAAPSDLVAATIVFVGLRPWAIRDVAELPVASAGDLALGLASSLAVAGLGGGGGGLLPGQQQAK